MRLSDHLRIASITKSFTATAILQLVESGRLKLSERLASFVKGIPNETGSPSVSCWRCVRASTTSR
jgi:CubicO group peptidase (beta-lactamase class C family)